MIIIADAGSTKIDWAVVDTEVHHYQSTGWNPTQDTKNLIIDHVALKGHLSKCQNLYYYSTGAGASAGIRRATEALQEYCPQAKIELNGDLLGAARALFNDKEGIAVIIGTGSNVCFYDGQKLSQATPSLGYLLSDEGSGFAIGKNILKDYFYHRMPQGTSQQFSEQYQLSKSKLLDIMYSSPRPNASIAQYTRFLESVDNDWKRNLIYSNFETLVKEKILPHKNFLSVPIGFVGSIGKVYHEILQEVCLEYGIKHIKTIAKPIDALISFHE